MRAYGGDRWRGNRGRERGGRFRREFRRVRLRWGPPPTTTKFKRIVSFAGSGLPLGQFEGQQNAAADFERVLDGLESGRESFPLVVAEIGVAGAGGDDERIVRNFLSFVFGLVTARTTRRSRSKPVTSAMSTSTFLWRLQNRADGRGDFARRETGGGHLIEQRLEGVMILPVDDGDVHGRAGQRLGCVQAAEARSDDHHAMCSLIGHFMCRLAVQRSYSIRFSAMAIGSRSSDRRILHPAWVRWLVPSVGRFDFRGACWACWRSQRLSVRLLGDAGIGWHIRTGQLILATHAIPRVDPFSSTMAGQPWFAWEWLYDVVVGWLDSAAGLNGVVLFTALIIAVMFSWTFRLLLRRGTNVLVALGSGAAGGVGGDDSFSGAAARGELVVHGGCGSGFWSPRRREAIRLRFELEARPVGVAFVAASAR